MKFVKTYGINGLLEWHGEVRSNGIRMKVDFTNGSVTAYGVAPATFTTKNELTQYIIENSDMFKGGRIRLVSKQELPGSEDEEKAPAKEQKATESPAPVAENAGTIDVTDKAEAVEWLKEHYPEKGYTGFKLRSKEAFYSACRECGVTFSFK